MRIKKNLLKPAVLLSAVCLFLAVVGTADAAELLGIHASADNDTGDTSTIMLIDTALGTAIEVADTGLSRVAEGTDSSAVNGLPGPNGLAFDTDSAKCISLRPPTQAEGRRFSTRWWLTPRAGHPVFWAALWGHDFLTQPSSMESIGI